MDPDTALQWVERLGGWAVVVFIVWALMRNNAQDRKDHKEEMQEVVDAFKRAVDGWDTSSREADLAHERIIQTQNQLLSELRSIKP